MATPAQVAEYAARAGWRGQDLVTAVAVAWAESSGRESAHNTKKGADSRGLWQVNVAHYAHPEFAGDNLYDGQTNANDAYKIWTGGHGWGPWQAHNNGTYLLFVPLAMAAVESAGVKKIITDPVGVAAGLTQSVTDAAKQLPGVDMLDQAKNAVGLAYKAGGWLGNRNNWIRVAYVMLGAGLVWGGFLMVIGKPVGDTTMAVAGGLLGTREAGAAAKTTKRAATTAKAASTSAKGSK